MGFGKRIKQMIMHLGISQNEFGRQIGVSGTVISHWVTERNEPIASKIIEMLNVFPEFSINWLMRGVGPMFQTEIENSKEKQNEKDKDHEIIDLRFKLLEKRVDQLEELVKLRLKDKN